MRKLVLLVALFLVSNGVFAQQSVFDKFDGQDKIVSVIMNKKMFSLLGKMKAEDKETQQYVDLIKKLDNLKVFVTDNALKASEMKATTDKYLKTAALDELMQINDKGKNVKIYVKSGVIESQVKELLMFIDGSEKEETVLMSLTGDFDINEVPLLIEKMNLPGGDALKKVTKSRK